ncbi:MAG: hypothetical protein Edafosvirus16_14 [Edafosvirus sp.]|uniref:MORN repeat protein n=1 Tax=Edafosvirus sp. TaxID=2487765 RepID=A0A3G4ZUE7_9VIRU|nr:MAG: hypothetical protein Edafosvirus16_14 [Edafosvirus sp.]
MSDDHFEEKDVGEGDYEGDYEGDHEGDHEEDGEGDKKKEQGKDGNYYFYHGETVTTENDGNYHFYDTKGKLFKTAEYKNGKLNGTQHIYNSDGKIWESAEYKDDKLNGVYIKWNQYLTNKPVIELECEYLDGVLHGKYELYGVMGYTKEMGNYKNGIKDGAWSKFDKDGMLLYTYGYKDGEMLDKFITADFEVKKLFWNS